MEVVKVLVVVLLGMVVVSLGKAMFHLSSGPEDSAKTVQALTVRHQSSHWPCLHCSSLPGTPAP